MKKTTFKVVDSRFDRESIHRQLDYMLVALSDGYYDLSLKRYSSSRSGQQNRYYWKILDAVEEYTGEDKISLHVFFGNKFLSFFSECFGEKTLAVQSTTALSVKEMNEYLEKVIAFITTNISPDFILPDYDTIRTEEE